MTARHSAHATVLAGPAIVTQLDTTTLVPPGWSAEVHASGTLVIRRVVGCNGTLPHCTSAATASRIVCRQGAIALNADAPYFAGFTS